MKLVARLFFGVTILWLVTLIVAYVLADYDYSKQIESYWALAEKASTIQQKSAYLDRFVAALEATQLAENNALFLKTPDNNVSHNMTALKSLQGRMHEIIRMDPSSFQYQQAMYQITAQEQGEAKEMLQVFSGAWWLEHHLFLWAWIGLFHFILVLVLSAVSAFASFSDVLDE